MIHMYTGWLGRYAAMMVQIPFALDLLVMSVEWAFGAPSGVDIQVAPSHTGPQWPGKISP